MSDEPKFPPMPVQLSSTDGATASKAIAGEFTLTQFGLDRFAGKTLLYGKHCRGPGCDDFNEQHPSCACTCSACREPMLDHTNHCPSHYADMRTGQPLPCTCGFAEKVPCTHGPEHRSVLCRICDVVGPSCEDCATLRRQLGRLQLDRDGIFERLEAAQAQLLRMDATNELTARKKEAKKKGTTT